MKKNSIYFFSILLLICFLVAIPSMAQTCEPPGSNDLIQYPLCTYNVECAAVTIVAHNIQSTVKKFIRESLVKERIVGFTTALAHYNPLVNFSNDISYMSYKDDANNKAIVKVGCLHNKLHFMSLCLLDTEIKTSSF